MISGWECLSRCGVWAKYHLSLSGRSVCSTFPPATLHHQTSCRPQHKRWWCQLPQKSHRRGDIRARIKARSVGRDSWSDPPPEHPRKSVMSEPRIKGWAWAWAFRNHGFEINPERWLLFKFFNPSGCLQAESKTVSTWWSIIDARAPAVLVKHWRKRALEMHRHATQSFHCYTDNPHHNNKKYILISRTIFLFSLPFWL